MLEETDRIDMCMVAPDGRVMLIMTDAGITTDQDQRFQLMVQKLNTYLDYITGQQFAKDQPGKSPGDVVIQVVCAEPPSEAMRRLQRACPADRPDVLVPVQYVLIPKP